MPGAQLLARVCSLPNDAQESRPIPSKWNVASVRSNYTDRNLERKHLHSAATLSFWLRFAMAFPPRMSAMAAERCARRAAPVARLAPYPSSTALTLLTQQPRWPRLKANAMSANGDPAMQRCATAPTRRSTA